MIKKIEPLYKVGNKIFNNLRDAEEYAYKKDNSRYWQSRIDNTHFQLKYINDLIKKYKEILRNKKYKSKIEKYFILSKYYSNKKELAEYIIELKELKQEYYKSLKEGE